MKRPKVSRSNCSELEIRSKHVALFKKSGMSQKRYCEENNLNIWTFRGWLKQQKSKSELIATKIPRKVTRQIISTNSRLELKVGEKVTIKIPEDFNPNVLKKLLETLEVFK